MKSKFLKTIGLALATVACIGMTAFAAPSPTASTPQFCSNICSLIA